jgi:hypothetical protein
MAFWDKEELVTTVEKNKAEKIEVYRTELKDKKYIYFHTLKKVGEEWEHTTKSVSIPADKMNEIIAALAKDTSDKEG